VFGKRVLGSIIGTKRDEVTGGRRKLHDEGLHNLYPSPNVTGVIKSRRICWAGHVVYVEEQRSAYEIFVGKPEGMRQLGTLVSKRNSDIKIDIKDKGCESVDWIHVDQDRN
jgi:hypothetical protein